MNLSEAEEATLREQIALVRSAEDRYNAVRTGSQPATPRETAALQGLAAAIEVADLVEAMLPAPVPRIRAQRATGRSSAAR